MTTESDTIRANVDAYLAEIGMTFETFYVGQTKRDDWGCFEWRVALYETKSIWSNGQKSKPPLLATPYYMGLAHRHPKKGAFQPPKGASKNSLAYEAWERGCTAPTPPTAAEVLYSLMLDGEAINESFSDWCSDLGYDSDSIKALNTYRECEETGKLLRKVFTHEQRERLRELTQNL